MQTSQAQVWTRDRYEYGLFVVTAMGDSQALNHAWYLQNKQPGVPNFQAQWAWTEFDWEYVPQVAAATPTNRIVGTGSASPPFGTVQAYNVEMTSYAGVPGPLQEQQAQRTDDSFASAILDGQWAWMAQHGTLGLNWPTPPTDPSSPWNWMVEQLYLRPANVETDPADGWQTMSTFSTSTIGWGNPYYCVSSDSLLSVPTYIIGASPNNVQMAWPDAAALTDAISVNVISAPAGSTPLIAYDPGTSTYSVPNPDAMFVPVRLNAASSLQYQGMAVPEYLWQFFYPTDPAQGGTLNPGQAWPGRQSFVYGGTGAGAYTPATVFYDYTIAWTPERVAFYILPAGQGASIQGQTPVYVLDTSTSPPVGNLGPGAAGASAAFWSQRYDASLTLGAVFLSFQLWNMGAGSFSGTQSGDGAMYIRKAQVFPYQKTSLDFAVAPTLSIDFTTFTSTSQMLAEMTKHFAVLNGAPAALYYSADNLQWVTAPDGSPALKMASVYNDGTQAQWYGLGPAGYPAGTGSADLSQQVVAKIDDAQLGAGQSLTFACSSSGEDADWFQVQGSSSTSPITAWLYIKNPSSGAEAKAQITFTSDSGVTAPAWTIAAPTPIGTTTAAQATQLFTGLTGVPASTVISPQLYSTS